MVSQSGMEFWGKLIQFVPRIVPHLKLEKALGRRERPLEVGLRRVHEDQHIHPRPRQISGHPEPLEDRPGFHPSRLA
jgi:hypothetical protein